MVSCNSLQSGTYKRTPLCSHTFFTLVFSHLTLAWLVEKFPPNIRLTSAALGYDLAHCTASAFSPLVATLLVQEVSPTAPGYIYPFFAVFSVIGMFMSTKIHQSGGVDDVNHVQMQSVKGDLPQLT
jgi:hypothetical protein